MFSVEKYLEMSCEKGGRGKRRGTVVTLTWDENGYGSGYGDMGGWGMVSSLSNLF